MIFIINNNNKNKTKNDIPVIDINLYLIYKIN